MFKRSPSLTEQTKQYIKKRIIHNEFAEGRIPSEHELAATLGVSRTTIRDALARLELEGAIVRRQGAGTFVNKLGLQIRSRLEEIWSYEEVLRAHGYTPSVRVLQLKTLPASPDTAALLHIKAGEPLLFIEKLFLEDENPVILTQNTLPKKLLRHQFEAGDCQRPIYDFIAHCCGQQLAYYLSDIVLMLAGAEIGHLLQIDPQTPLLSFAEVGYNPNNHPILQSASFFRDDLLRFRMMRRQIP